MSDEIRKTEEQEQKESKPEAVEKSDSVSSQTFEEKTAKIEEKIDQLLNIVAEKDEKIKELEKVLKKHGEEIASKNKVEKLKDINNRIMPTGVISFEKEGQKLIDEGAQSSYDKAKSVFTKIGLDEFYKKTSIL